MPDTETPQQAEPVAAKKLCQIVVTFQTNTDEEAMSVNGAINKALTPFPDVATSFNITTGRRQPVSPFMRQR